MRILIAGVGNVLRGDDGFGVELLRHVKKDADTSHDLRFFESGIAGISLIQQLLDGYDALILLDALQRGVEPGTVLVLEPDATKFEGAHGPCRSIDLHQADPEAVLALAAAMRVLPRRAWIVGCQVQYCDELGAGLSEPVRRALPGALERVHDLLDSLHLATS